MSVWWKATRVKAMENVHVDVDDRDAVVPNHVMLSYSWDDQKTIVRMNESLKRRKYNTWMDVRRGCSFDSRELIANLPGSMLQTEQMKGSIMDAMSDAVEGAEVVLYGVSRGYKESANCRLEANYAHQQE